MIDTSTCAASRRPPPCIPAANQLTSEPTHPRCSLGSNDCVEPHKTSDLSSPTIDALARAGVRLVTASTRTTPALAVAHGVRERALLVHAGHGGALCNGGSRCGRMTDAILAHSTHRKCSVRAFVTARVLRASAARGSVAAWQRCDIAPRCKQTLCRRDLRVCWCRGR